MRIYEVILLESWREVGKTRAVDVERTTTIVAAVSGDAAVLKAKTAALRKTATGKLEDGEPFDHEVYGAALEGLRLVAAVDLA